MSLLGQNSSTFSKRKTLNSQQFPAGEIIKLTPAGFSVVNNLGDDAIGVVCFDMGGYTVLGGTFAKISNDFQPFTIGDVLFGRIKIISKIDTEVYSVEVI